MGNNVSYHIRLKADIKGQIIKEAFEFRLFPHRFIEVVNAIFDFSMSGGRVSLVELPNSKLWLPLVIFILYLGKENLKEFPEYLFLGTALIGVNIVMTPLKGIK